MPAAELQRGLRRWGGVLALAVLLLLPLSYGLAGVCPFGLYQSREAAGLREAVGALGFLPDDLALALKRYVSGDSFLREPALAAALYGGLLLVATAAAARVLALLVRRPEAVDDRAVRTLLRFGVLFAALSVLAYPIFTQDFWLSVVWGRMAAHGTNPYFNPFSEAGLAGVPMEGYEARMTYGPLWGLCSAALTSLCGRRPPLEFVAFKGVLLGAWIACLLLVRRIASLRHGPAGQAVAVTLFGWLPVSFHLAVGEGHNDVVMVALLLLWLDLALRGRHLLSPAVLAASVAVKYVSFPVLALELLRGLRRRLRPPRALLTYLAALAAGALVALAAVAAFARDASFLEATAGMSSWRLLTPSVAVVEAAQRLGLAPAAAWLDAPLPALDAYRRVDALVLLALAPALLVPLGRELRGRGGEPGDLEQVLFAGLAATALVLAGHTWPWFLLWPLAAGCLVWRRPLFRLLLPLFFLAPFAHLFWICLLYTSPSPRDGRLSRMPSSA